MATYELEVQLVSWLILEILQADDIIKGSRAEDFQISVSFLVFSPQKTYAPIFRAKISSYLTAYLFLINMGARKGCFGGPCLKRAVGTRKIEIFQKIFLDIPRDIISKQLSFSYRRFMVVSIFRPRIALP